MKLHLLSGLIFIITISFSAASYGQITVKGKDANFINYSNLSLQSKRIYDTDIYQGDIYLHDDWKPAEFTLPDESTVEVDSVKFNLLRGHVEIYRAGEHLQLYSSMFDSFKYMEKKDVLYKSKHYFFNEGERLPGLIKTIEIGDYSVLVSYKPEVRNVSEENPLMLGELKKDRVRVTKLRFIEKDGALTRIKSKKDLQKFFNSDKSIKSYISKNKLSHKEEDDIAKVLAYSLEAN